MGRHLVAPSAWSWIAVTLGIGIATLGSSSCIQIGPDAKDGSAGADDGSTNDATVEDQCRSVVTEFCARAEECYGRDPETCVEPGIDACCGRACAKPGTTSARAIATCVSDLKAATCDSIDQAGSDPSQMPQSCQHVVKY